MTYYLLVEEKVEKVYTHTIAVDTDKGVNDALKTIREEIESGDDIFSKYDVVDSHLEDEQATSVKLLGAVKINKNKEG